MKRLTTFFTIFLLFTFIGLFTSCKWGQKRELPKGKNIICLIDFSEAKNSNERLKFYMTAIKNNIIPQLGLYDKITVLPIDKASVTNSSDIFLTNLAEENFEPVMASPMEKKELIQDSLNKYRKTLSVTFEQCFQTAINNRSKTSLETDIFGALENAKDKLSSRDDNYIVIFSDMMNWTKTIKMEPQASNFNAKNLTSVLSKAPSINLSNATIIILTGEQVDISADHFNLVKLFWTKYFEINNSKLYDYNSASLTKLKEIMTLKTE